MNPLIDFLINENGIPEQSILLLLLIPIVATIISIWRQVIGLSSFGIYAPIVMTFAFYQLGLTPNGSSLVQGIKYGLALSLVVFVSATIAHEITKKFKLHYLPKMSIILSIVAVGVFSLLTLGAYLNRHGFTGIDTLPLLLLITVSEQMISMYNKKGKKVAYLLSLSTLLFSCLTYIFISWGSLQNFLLKYPFVSILTLIATFLIGRWKGFRIKEYFRFKSLLTSSGEHI
jgi:hypothetical protein